jgi:hypothetical protein
LASRSARTCSIDDVIVVDSKPEGRGRFGGSISPATYTSGRSRQRTGQRQHDRRAYASKPDDPRAHVTTASVEVTATARGPWLGFRCAR